MLPNFLAGVLCVCMLYVHVCLCLHNKLVMLCPVMTCLLLPLLKMSVCARLCVRVCVCLSL
jgi:hypothetical protein